jgi:NADH dehydrogenase (ubiquinone) Fe-S protein 4
MPIVFLAHKLAVDCEERNTLWGKPGRSMLALRLSQRTATRCLAARPLPALAAARPARALSSAITKASGADKSVSKETAPAVDKETLQAFTGAPAAMMETRIVKIYQQPNTVQNATQNQIPWRMQWEDDQTNRWTNPLMGWTSTNDPLSNTHMTLEFHTAEDAMRFCERNGWKYEVAQSKPNKEMNASPKKYSDNFKWKGGKHCANA